MISNERPSPYGRGAYSPPKPPVAEDTLHSGEVRIERKNFVFTLKENPRGRFLRITEDLGARSNSIIIPAEGFHDFQKLLEQMTQAASEIPARTAAGNPVPAPLAPQP